MNVHVLQHVPFEDPAGIGDWIVARGWRWTATRLFAGEPLPSLTLVDWLVVMGGPMGVHDEALHPWLVPEKRFLEHAIQEGTPILGVCLGGQLLADVLGAPVTPNDHREIGWLPIELTPEAVRSPLRRLPRWVEVFHWHGDTFGIPAGAVRLAGSEGCANQAFSFGDRVLALQFHLDSTPDGVAALVRHCADELVPTPHRSSKYVQTAEEMLSSPARFADLGRHLSTVLEDLVGGAAARRDSR